MLALVGHITHASRQTMLYSTCMARFASLRTSRGIPRSLPGVFCILGIIGLALAWPGYAQAATVRQIIFPVIGKNSFSDDFGTVRVGHTHEGNDIIAKKGTPLVAAVDGTITYVAYPEPTYGYMVSITDADGYQYNYLHINNDAPGTDNGQGGGMNAYAPGMKRSWPVVKGQSIGWVGDSGNAENTVAHLHFEIRLPDDTAIDPYQSLRASTTIATSIIPPARPEEIVPFAQFQGGATIASGQIDPLTPEKELVIAAGPGGGPQVRIYRPDHSLVSNFFVQPTTIRSGLDVAAGDINGDGTDEIIVGLGPRQEPRVMIYDMQGNLIASFLAYTQAFRGGVHVTSADLNGDGQNEIITGPGAGGGPDVRVFTSAGGLLTSFFAYDPKFRGGVDVAGITALAGTDTGIIATSPGPGGGPEVRTFDPNGVMRSAFFADDKTSRGGTRISATSQSAQGPATLLTVPASRGVSTVHSFGLDGTAIKNATAFEPWWIGGYDLTDSDGTVYVTTAEGQRRASVETLNWDYSRSPYSHIPRFSPY